MVSHALKEGNLKKWRNWHRKFQSFFSLHFNSFRNRDSMLPQTFQWLTSTSKLVLASNSKFVWSLPLFHINIAHNNTKKIISKNSMKNEIYFWPAKLTWLPPASKNLECSSLSKGHKNCAIFGVLILWKLLFFSREFIFSCWYGKLPYDFTSPLFNGTGRNRWWTQNKNQNGNQPRTGLN